MPEVHTFEDTTDAYDASQSDDSIKDGDVLVCAREGVIGFLYSAWPVYVVADVHETIAGPHVDSGVFHKVLDWERFTREHPHYGASIDKCLEVAHTDGDITGNDHWKEAKDPRE